MWKCPVKFETDLSGFREIFPKTRQACLKLDRTFPLQPDKTDMASHFYSDLHFISKWPTQADNLCSGNTLSSMQTVGYFA